MVSKIVQLAMPWCTHKGQKNAVILYGEKLE